MPPIIETNSVSSQSHVPAPPGIPYIIGNEVAVRFSESGMSSILFVFISKYLLDNAGMPQLTEAQSMVWYHNFVSAGWLFAIIGALTADIFFGKYKTIIASSLIYCFGYLILAFFNTKLGLICGLTLVAIGAGGINPCVTAHVGDQFDRTTRHLLSKIYGWFYFAINFGGLVAILLIPYLLEKYGPKIAFLVPGILMLIATIIFYQGREVFVTIAPIGWKNYLKELQNEENKKAVYNLLIIFAFITVFFTLHGQYSSSWVMQAGEMNREINLGFFKFSLNQSQVQVLNPIFVIILMPVFSYFICPFFDRSFRSPHLKKIVVGFFLAGASFIVVAVAEWLIEQGKEVSIIWQVWAFFLLTAGEILIAITTFEFAYTHAPNSMKSLIIALYMLAASIGNKLTSEFYSFAQDANGDLTISGSYYFLYFAATMILVGILFIIYMPYYKGKVHLQKIKNHLPNRSIEHYSKVRQITEIIAKITKKKVDFILFLGPVARRGKEFIEGEKIIDEDKNSHHFLIVTKLRKDAKPAVATALENKIRKKLVSRGIEKEISSSPILESKSPDTEISPTKNDKIIITIESIDQFDLRSEGKRLFKEGILVYGNNEIKLLEPRQLTSSKRIAIAKEGYIYWYNQGMDFLRSYKTLKDTIHKKSLLVVHLHQATESFYSCAFLVLTGERPHSHELGRLNGLLCEESHAFLNIFPTHTSKQAECFRLLEKGYIDSRYEKNYVISNEQLEYLCERVEDLKDITEEVCKREIEFLESQNSDYWLRDM